MCARSVGSVAPFEATQTINFVLTTPAATGVTLTPSPASPQLPGTSVTFTAVASGGGAYEYQFLGRPAGGTFVAAQAYSNLNTWTWNTTGVPPGTYEIMVMARAAGSSAAFDATNSDPLRDHRSHVYRHPHSEPVQPADGRGDHLLQRRRQRGNGQLRVRVPWRTPGGHPRGRAAVRRHAPAGHGPPRACRPEPT